MYAHTLTELWWHHEHYGRMLLLHVVVCWKICVTTSRVKPPLQFSRLWWFCIWRFHIKEKFNVFSAVLEQFLIKYIFSCTPLYISCHIPFILLHLCVVVFVFSLNTYTPDFSSWVFWHYPSIYTRVFHSPYQVNVRRLPIQHIRFGGSFLVYKKVKHIESTKEGKQKYNHRILFGNI